MQGAEKIRREIAKRGIDAYFKVPQKWIYAVPQVFLPPSGYQTKYYILVEEDMDIVSDDENKFIWASSQVTPQMLDSLFGLLKTIGLNDCAKPDNIPFSRDGRIAFIDTQAFYGRVDYSNLTPYLSRSNQIYWEQLTSK